VTATTALPAYSTELPLTSVQLPRISVIMPAYNEEAHVTDCIQNAKKQLNRSGMPYEILLVNDGSTDRTREVASALNEDGRLRIVGYPQNQGKGFAVQYGSRFVVGDIVVLMDSDADVSPDLIQQYINVLQNSDLAIASKWHPESVVSTPILRRFLSHAFHVLVMLLTGVTVSDTQSGFKAFRRDALTRIMTLISVKRYAYDVEVLTVAKLLNMKVAELPIKIQLSSLFSIRQVFRMLVDLLGITYRLRVIRWYQSNLSKSQPHYEPIIKW